MKCFELIVAEIYPRNIYLTTYGFLIIPYKIFMLIILRAFKLEIQPELRS